MTMARNRKAQLTEYQCMRAGSLFYYEDLPWSIPLVERCPVCGACDTRAPGRIAAAVIPRGFPVDDDAEVWADQGAD